MGLRLVWILLDGSLVVINRLLEVISEEICVGDVVVQIGQVTVLLESFIVELDGVRMLLDIVVGIGKTSECLDIVLIEPERPLVVSDGFFGFTELEAQIAKSDQ